MAASLLLQYIIVVLAVLVSAGVVMYKQFPNAARRLRVALALPLLLPAQAASSNALQATSHGAMRAFMPAGAASRGR